MEFSQSIGLELLEQADGHARVRLTLKEEHMNSSLIAHGGVLMSMADLAMGAAAHSLGPSVVTMDLQYRFFKPAMVGECVIADGMVVRFGRHIAVTEGTLHVGDRLIGHATGQFYYEAP